MSRTSRTHKGREAAQRKVGLGVPSSRCPCGKAGYASRKLAKLAGRRLHEHERCNAYRCDRSDRWHLGHLDPRVRAGVITRDQAYG